MNLILIEAYIEYYRGEMYATARANGADEVQYKVKPEHVANHQAAAWAAASKLCKKHGWAQNPLCVRRLECTESAYVFAVEGNS